MVYIAPISTFVAVTVPNRSQRGAPGWAGFAWTGCRDQVLLRRHAHRMRVGTQGSQPGSPRHLPGLPGTGGLLGPDETCGQARRRRLCSTANPDPARDCRGRLAESHVPGLDARAPGTRACRHLLQRYSFLCRCPKRKSGPSSDYFFLQPTVTTLSIPCIGVPKNV